MSKSNKRSSTKDTSDFVSKATMAEMLAKLKEEMREEHRAEREKLQSQIAALKSNPSGVQEDLVEDPDGILFNKSKWSTAEVVQALAEKKALQLDNRDGRVDLTNKHPNHKRLDPDLVKRMTIGEKSPRRSLI